jgi:endonuclease/exonuclease/phosphatase family metal-dependent hydrolase
MRIRHSIRAAVIAASLLSACAPAARRPDGIIRALVYNIHAGKDAGGADNLERVAAIVRDSHADLVLLQEVDSRTRRSGRVDQLERLRSLTGFNGVFGKAIEYDDGEYGVAILSRWPIQSFSMIMLPVSLSDSAARARYEARGALVAKVKSPSGLIRVMDTHLDATRGDSNRILQAARLLVVASTQRDSGFTLIGGDLNSEPGGPVVRMLSDSGWRDLFASCGSGQPFSFPAKSPVKRIDYLLTSNDAECRSASVIETEASDHRPVLFEIARSRRN